ncbi:hypothetical protein LMH87_000858 [Akanthomyces muscarius]|uniref:non-specific serine/threonine protein kinase n=1 Tax=Akanthomyces muscarius TaxID=2231603 RepID=A0A9W8QFD5_AKAMU|nr:hypothetical protein LMH87_000858 [Akanthomyces muscarius]KAJ4155622.1 hypothetical protein LMH87_000858 [Akanthomyces muscarius]
MAAVAGPQGTVLDIDSLPDDPLYRIRRYIGGRATVVYVHVSTTEFLAEDNRTYGPGIIRLLSKLDEWRRPDWKTLTITMNAASTLQIDVDAFQPHSMSPASIHGCYGLFDVLNLKREYNVKARTRHCLARGAEVYVKLARFEFEVRALEREVKVYHRLCGSAVSPALVGYVYEDTHDRVVGFITEELVGHYPESTDDYVACSEALRDLHEVGVIHGDMNKYNIIMTKDGPKFIDFEASRLRDETTDWEKLAEKEKQNLYKGLSDQSGLGAPWDIET